MPNLKKMLNPGDASIIDATTTINWIPKDPAEVILPYTDKLDKDPETSEVEERIEWTKEVLDKYTDLGNKCKELEAQIEDRCKAVKTTLNTSTDKRVIEAMGRVFGVETEEITFEQYKICIKELAKINNQTGLEIK